MLKKLLSSLVFVLVAFFTTAQEYNYANLEVVDYKKSKKYIIKEINVNGIKYLDKSVLVSVSGLFAGQQVDVPGEAFSDAIQKFWNQGLFSDVKLTIREELGDSISVDIYLQERNRISELEIVGLKKSQESDIREKLELKKGMQVTENLKDKAERIIKDYLYDKKYLNSQVDIVLVDDTTLSLNNVKLKIIVDKGEKVKIKDINFEGATVFKDGKLRRLMKETKKVNLNFFKGSKYIEDLYEEDKQKIIAEYKSKGYRDAEIVKDSVYYVEDDRLAIDIEIAEGDQYYFGNINWVGNTKYPTEALDEYLKIEKGDPYDEEKLSMRLNVDEDAVGNLYLDNGYLFFNVQPVIQNINNDTIDLQMRIFEGDRVRINKIIINGNTKTNEHVIRRELRTKPSDLFSKSDIMRSQRELAQLGYFDAEQMGIEPININQAEGKVDLQYTVVEKSTDQLEISGGWGNNMFVGSLGVRFSNFSAKNMFKKGAWKPIPAGDGQTLSIRAQTNGKHYSAYSLSFVEPWLGGKKPTSLSVSAYYSIQKRVKNYWTFDIGDEYMKVIGATVGIGQRLKWPDDFFTIYNAVNYQLYDLNDWSGFIVNNGKANNLSLTTTFGRNSVDAPIYPRSGSSFSLSLQFTPPYSLFKEDQFWLLSGTEKTDLSNDIRDTYAGYSDEDWADVITYADPLDEDNREIFIESRITNTIDEKENNEKYKWAEYHKWKYKGSWYLRLWKDLVLATNTEFGYLGYYNQDVGYTPFGRFNLGGDGLSGYSLYGVETIGLRGYENGSLTSIDKRGASAGNVYEKINFELRYPITLKPQAAVYVLGFVEAGNTWSSIGDYNPFSVKRSAGIGLRAFLPMFGLLGVDWGYGFDRDNSPTSTGIGGSQFHFVIGQQF